MGDDREHRSSDVQRSERIQRSERAHDVSPADRGVAQRSSDSAPRVQAMRVGARDDPQEREADRVADAVVRRASHETPVRASSSASNDVRRWSLVEPPKHEEGNVHKGQDVHTPIVRRAGAGDGDAGMNAAAGDAVRTRGGGEPIDDVTRARIESQLGADLSHVRVHRGAREAESARALNARAFTHQNHIWLGAGQSPQDLHLMAHEATHVVQQGAAGSNAPVRRAPAPASGAAAVSAVAPEVVELAGHASFTPSVAVDQWLAAQPHGKGLVPVRYRSLAAGSLTVQKRATGYDVQKQGIALQHPWLDSASAVLGPATPMLVLRSNGAQLTGWVGTDTRGTDGMEFVRKLFARAEAFGLAGFNVPAPAKSPFRFEGGKLVLALENHKVQLGQTLDGTFTLKLGDDRSVDFRGTVTVKVPGLVEGPLEIVRTPDGLITGTAKLAVTLNAGLSGDVVVNWDGHALTGEGKVAYAGEKLSGSVTLRLSRPGEETTAAAAAGAAGKRGPVRNRTKGGYVVSGEGELDFHFTDWLAGRAQVVIDERGNLTVVGEIRPPAEVELLAQRTYTKPLFKVEARAVYGLPVVGNLFLFANVGMDAEAQIGPAKLRQIEIKGTYSTDPQKPQDFSISGALGFSASAGVRMRAEGGAGLEVLGHDLKAGAAVDAVAGVRGYAEARPTLGYREKLEPGKEKRGEFFLKGELELAAQPFLALNGELFVEVDAPWWSPIDDHKWTWPLGNLTYPLGGGVGMRAAIDYVIGSDQWPKVDFKPVEFSGEKFMTDVFEKKAPKGKADADEKSGSWKDGTPPAAETAQAPGAKPAASGGAKPKGGRVTAGPPSPELERARRAAEKKGGAPDRTKSKGEAQPSDPAKQKKLDEALTALASAIDKLPGHEATAEEAQKVADDTRRAHPVFQTLAPVDKGEQWLFEYTASPKKKAAAVKKQQESNGKKLLARDKLDASDYPTGKGSSKIPIRWYKPRDMYPRLRRKGTTDEIYTFPQKVKLSDSVTLNPKHVWGAKAGPSHKRQDRGAADTAEVRTALEGWHVETDSGTKLDEYHVDHIWELALGGSHAPNNMWPLKPAFNLGANAVYNQWVAHRESSSKDSPVLVRKVSSCEHGLVFDVRSNTESSSAGSHGTMPEAPVNKGTELR